MFCFLLIKSCLRILFSSHGLIVRELPPLTLRGAYLCYIHAGFLANFDLETVDDSHDFMGIYNPHSFHPNESLPEFDEIRTKAAKLAVVYSMQVTYIVFCADSGPLSSAH